MLERKKRPALSGIDSAFFEADREAVRAEQAAELAKFKALAGALEDVAYSVEMISYERHKLADEALRQYKEARDAG